MKKITLSVLVFGAITTAFSQNLSFTKSNQSFINIATRNGTVAEGDVDEDGDVDVFISGNRPNFDAALYLNDGNGNFTRKTNTSFVGLDLAHADFADLDGDGDLDLFYTGRDWQPMHYALLYLNDGNGNFTQKESHGLPICSEGDFEFGDIDNDQDLDIIITGYRNSNPFVELYRNVGSAQFVLKTTANLPALTKSGNVAFLDCDNDQDLDFFVSGSNTSAFTNLYLNNGLGDYTLSSNNISEGSFMGDIEVGDSDKDGDLDLIIATGMNTSLRDVNLYLNNGSGLFVKSSNTHFVGVAAGDVQFADFDSDGDNDVLITGLSSSGFGGSKNMATVYENLGLNQFSNGTPLSGVVYSRSVVADFNGDNKKDILICGEPSTSLYFNDNLTTGVGEQLENNTFKLYPNPSNDYVFVEYPSFKNDKLTVRVISSEGSVMYNQYHHVSHGNNTISISTETLSKGLYILNIENEVGAKVSKKIFKQ
ncbi:MAG TPA: hypothetical protein DCR46_01180 [Cytophagales bacterium]|nr:hypothetical protein [Cytophagales bacterium]